MGQGVSQWMAVIIGLASGVGGAAAMVAVFQAAFRGLERSVEATCKAIKVIEQQMVAKANAADMEMRLRKVDEALEQKLDRAACERCHQDLERDLARGSKHFEDLFALQKENSVTISNIHKSLGNMDTSIQLLAQRVEDIGKTVARVTKVSLWDGNERRKD
jgi:hypothetical protein